MTKYINNLIIDDSNKPQEQNNVPFVIEGDVGAVFSIKVMQNQNNVIKFYNFKSSTFETGFKAANKLNNIKLSGNSYNSSIVLPVISTNAATYTIFVHAEKHFNTSLNEFFSPENDVCYTVTIDQVLDTTLTFGIKTGGSDDNYVSSSISSAVEVVSTGSTAKKTISVLKPSNFTWEPTNVETDARGFGLILTRQPKASDWLFREVDTVDGTTSSSTTLKVDSLTNLGVGMKIVNVSSGSLSGTPSITDIDKNTKTLTLSSAQSFSDGIVVTFEAAGAEKIKAATGVDLVLSATAEYKEQLTQVVREDVSSSTAITLNKTYGIAKGATIRGLGVNNSSANAVQTINADADGGGGDGSITVPVSQTLSRGTKLYIDGCAKTIVIKPNIKINSYPESNVAIYLQAGNFIAVGTAS